MPKSSLWSRSAGIGCWVYPIPGTSCLGYIGFRDSNFKPPDAVDVEELYLFLSCGCRVSIISVLSMSSFRISTNIQFSGFGYIQVSDFGS